MNKTWLTIIACVVALVGAFAAGRMSVTETVTTVAAGVNIDSLKNIFQAGKVDSASLEDLMAENSDLRDLIKGMKLSGVSDEPWPNRMPLDETPAKPPPLDQKVATWTMDTTKPVDVDIVTISGEDTLHAKSTSNINVHVLFMGAPVNTFWLVNASVDPFEIHRSVVDKSRSDTDWGSLSFRGMLAGGGGVGVGGQFEFGRIGAGVLFVSDTRPLYVVTCKIFEL
jgi:hypothetical protein